MAATTDGGIFFSKKIKHDSSFISRCFAPQFEEKEDYPPDSLLHNENGSGLANELFYFICYGLDGQRFWVISFKEVFAIPPTRNFFYLYLKESRRYSRIRVLDPGLSARLKSAQQRPDQNPLTRAKIEAVLGRKNDTQ